MHNPGGERDSSVMFTTLSKSLTLVLLSSAEYVFFVNTRQEISMYWKDSDQSKNSTRAHPINQWTPGISSPSSTFPQPKKHHLLTHTSLLVNVDIDSVHRASGLGYTDYMIYQGEDATIRGANLVWAAENTTVAEGTEDGLDTWTIQDVQTDDPIRAIPRTHLSITALATGSGGRMLTAFFQREGDDISMYTRDRRNVGGVWQAARSPI